MNMKGLNNQGSAVVEATLIIPLFLFSMLAIYQMIQCRIAEGMIYEGAIETAEYLAEYAYINSDGILLSELFFNKYLDDVELVERYVEDGISGIVFNGTKLTDENYILLKLHYSVGFSLPFLPKFSKQREITIKQKAYLGDEDMFQGESMSLEQYVYITDNRDVYHQTRNCTYLTLSIRSESFLSAEELGYTPCEFCGAESFEKVYVTDYGDRYHSDMRCSGLKRTIYRVKLSEVEEIGGCSRCVN